MAIAEKLSISLTELHQNLTKIIEKRVHAKG
jgi:hypothetical protein